MMYDVIYVTNFIFYVTEINKGFKDVLKLQRIEYIGNYTNLAVLFHVLTGDKT